MHIIFFELNGVHNFLRKLWRHLHDEHNNILITENAASENSFKTINNVTPSVDLSESLINIAIHINLQQANPLT